MQPVCLLSATSEQHGGFNLKKRRRKKKSVEIKIAFKGRKRKPSMILCTEVDQTMLHSGKVGDKKRQSSASSESRHAERTLCGACNFLTPRTAIRPRAG